MFADIFVTDSSQHWLFLLLTVTAVLLAGQGLRLRGQWGHMSIGRRVRGEQSEQFENPQEDPGTAEHPPQDSAENPPDESDGS